MAAHEAEVLFAGEINGRPTIELRHLLDGSHEAFFVAVGAPPVATGVSIETSGDKRYLTCLIRNKKLRFKPEEVVRQKVLIWLTQKLGYLPAQISVEVPIVIGGSVHDKAADIVVYEDEKKENPSIIVEVKKPKRKEGIEQLKSYMNATGAPFGYWADGLDEKVLLRTDPNDFSKPIWRLPALGETLEDIDEPLTRDKLSPVKDLYGVFKDIEQEILAHQTVDTFNEIFKVVFAKLYDERVNLHNATAEVVVPKVPAAVKEEVCDFVAQSIAARKQFIEAWNSQQSLVEEYLSSSLGPPPPDPVIEVGHIPCFHVANSHTFFDLDGPRRFDAEFFRREFVEFSKRLVKTKGVFKLGERFTAFAGKSPRAGNSTVLRLRQAQLTGFGVNLSGLEEVEAAATVGSKSLLQKMDVLLACTAHEPYYVGRRVDIVDELASDQTPIIPVPDVMIIRERAGQTGNPHFLTAFLNTSWGRLQIQRLNRGVRGGHVYGQDVEEFVWIPEPQPGWLTSFTKAQIAIRSLRSQSIESMKAAIDKLETALQ